jgi:hypothetical protein
MCTETSASEAVEVLAALAEVLGLEEGRVTCAEVGSQDDSV